MSKEKKVVVRKDRSEVLARHRATEASKAKKKSGPAEYMKGCM